VVPGPERAPHFLERDAAPALGRDPVKFELDLERAVDLDLVL
jgi:hypothetical protein